MVSESVRCAIVELHCGGSSNPEICKTLKLRRDAVKRVVDRFRETGDVQDRPRSGRKKTARTPQVREAVRKMIKRNPDRSIMKLAKKYKIGYASMHKLVTEDLHLKSYKISRGHLLTDAKKAERLQKCKKLRAESRGSGFANVVFSDEKIFTI
ncbi:hypothetical protein QR680_014620 [Steinernema hermaphroditum]|uniref:Paired domain-containing protein n=1 Tax=Steinernema hermaphroditum TaxID=289476 RepID=A0AA39M491_9BILA|nr:hypothetical protein QR680_014620 [Steinernema hermaphroditum]